MNNEIKNATGDQVKTLTRRETLRKPRNTIEAHVAMAKPTIIRAKPIMRAASTRLPITNILNKDIDDLQQDFRGKASLTNDYFNEQKRGKKQPKASCNTLASLGSHRLTVEQAATMLGQLDPPPCAAEIKRRIEEIEQDLFPRIMAQMLVGYDVLLFGFGSKMSVLDSFHKKHLSTENSIIVPGFSANVSIHTILNTIIETYMANDRLSSRSINGMAEAIRDHFNDRMEEKLFIVIHNIDGPSLRNSGNIFSILKKSKGIRIIASVDHVHSPMMWTENKVDWLWHDCTTLKPYMAETRLDNARLMSDKVNRGMASLIAVIGSLNSQAKTVFLHLAQYQLSHGGRGQYDGMLLDKLYSICKDNLLVNSELALRTHLTEFRDHKLVHIRPGLNQSDHIKIVLDEASIREFVDNFTD